MTTRSALLLLILLVMLASGFGQQDQRLEFDALLTAARQAQSMNNYASAADFYKKAVKIQGDLPELWTNLGLMEHETGDYDEAIESFRKANRLKPSLYAPILFLGIDYVRANKASEAIPFLLKAVKIKSTDPLAFLTLGRAYYSLGKVPLAVQEYRRAITLDARDGSGWFDLGIAYLAQVERQGRQMSVEGQGSAYANALFAESLTQQSRYKEAVDLYRHIIASKPQPPCMRSELGFVYLKQHYGSNARLEFEDERQAEPSCALATLGLARSYIDSGSNMEALKLLEELWNHDQGFMRSNSPLLAEAMLPDPFSTFGAFLAERHDSGDIQAGLYELLAAVFSGAPPQPAPMVSTSYAGTSEHSGATLPFRDYRRAAEEDCASGRYGQCANRLKNDPAKGSADSLLLLATCSFLTGDYELSANASAAFLAMSPHSLQALYWSIKANERLAFESLAKFQQLEPNSAKSDILLGDIYRQQHRYEDAQVEYERALAKSPNDVAALLGLANAYFGNANVEKTVEIVQTALRKSPDDPELNLLMSEALVSRHDFVNAMPFLEKSLGVKPQALPHVHALLGEAELLGGVGTTQDAINHLKLGLESDEDGSVHYQLSRAYLKIGDAKNASAAIEQMKAIQRQRRQRAATAVGDSALPNDGNDQQ